MSTSTSDHDMSESSNLDSPQSYGREQIYSPSLHIPQITTNFNDLSCADNKYHLNGIVPFLRILEEPQDYFRFRYVSEMVGTHGCLLGKTSSSSKTKTHPTVELVNYHGQARIRCRLAQHKNNEEHPHRLLEEERDSDVNYVVPEHGSYKVGFAGMGIIHTAKKDVPNLLCKSLAKKFPGISEKELRARSEQIAKRIDLNIVRLRFSAHDLKTDEEICRPVFSEPIHNMKSAATNDLKICRMSLSSGRPKGGEDVFIFVEKVNKKNIQIRFFELDVNGERCWEAPATFLQSDVHHQYGIVFRTPAYINPEISDDKNVFVELVRPSDGRLSEPHSFTYKAELVFKAGKKRKTSSSPFSSLTSSSSGSIKSLSDLPKMLAVSNDIPEDDHRQIEIPTRQFTPPSMSSPAHCDLADALMNQAESGPVWGQQNVVSSIPDIRLDSAELDVIVREVPSAIAELYDDPMTREYLNSCTSLEFPSLDNPQGMGFIHTLNLLRSDSGKNKSSPVKEPVKIRPETQENKSKEEIKKEPTEYSAYYNSEDGSQVKKLLTELCNIIRNKKGYKKQEVRTKLEKLAEYRLSNGDTFLHMTLCCNEPSFENIVKIIHSVNMSRLLNYTNHKQQTILHLCVAHDMPSLVELLVSKGCNPMLKDINGDNVIHYAVKRPSCLEPLLSAIQKFHISYDVNDTDSDKSTALHLAAIYNNARGVSLLCAHGAGVNVQDSHSRTPLHLAALDLRADIVAALLTHTKQSDVDLVDECGNTALQIVCDISPVKEEALKIVKLLLGHQADPMKREARNTSAWSRSKDKPEIRELMKDYVTAPCYEEDVKSESEDEYDSADEYHGTPGLDVSTWGREVCALLDVGAWRMLPSRLNCSSLTGWFANQPSPTLTMLNHLKEINEDITAKSFMVLLEDMGLVEAANVIRRHLD